jgi:cytochrome c
MIARLSLVCAAALLATSVQAAAPSVKHGKSWFGRTCQNCHSTEIGVNKIGPSLRGVVGRKVASVPDFPYSDSMKANAAAGSGVWDAAALESYLADPRGDIHGVKMYFKGLAGAKDRADMIAYLKTLK